ncbi:type II secretion system protein [bacterium]|nr:type II secretion system protein [bacterium]
MKFREMLTYSALIEAVTQNAERELTFKSNMSRFRNKFGMTKTTELPRLLRSAGFTLTEVLITIGIIGVVAALTLPNLIQNSFEKRVVSQLREVQSILAQAVRHAEQEDGDVSGWGMNYDGSSQDAEIIAEKIKPYIKLAYDCGLTDEKSICTPNIIYKKLNGNNHINYSVSSNYYKIKLLNGSSIWFRSGKKNTEKFDIDFFIDINGSNPPNIVGKDLFNLLYQNGSVGISDAEKDSCKKDKSGWGCSYYILTNHNMNYLH